MATTFVPPYHAPITDPRTGLTTPQWMQYFQDLGALAKLSTVGTAFITDGAVTFAKLQNIPTDSLIGRDTAGTGVPETILLNATLSMDGSGNLRRAALTGDVTASAGSNATTIANDAVTNGKAANMAAYTFKVRNANSTGDPSDAALADFTTATPSSGDFVVGFTAAGVLKKYDVSGIAGLASGYTDEQVRDVIGAALVAGSNITITVNDGADTITITATGGGLSAGSPPTQVQFKSSVSSNSVTLDSAPTNGNLLIAICKDGSSSTLGAGWTSIAVDTSGVDYSMIAYKVAGGGESATQQPISASHNNNVICMWELSGQSATPVVDSVMTYLLAQAVSYTGVTRTIANLQNALTLAAIFTDGGTPETLTGCLNMTQDVLNNAATYSHFVAGHANATTPVAQLITRMTGSTISTKTGIVIITA